jgi:hypothetical protein
MFSTVLPPLTRNRLMAKAAKVEITKVKKATAVAINTELPNWIQK